MSMNPDVTIVLGICVIVEKRVRPVKLKKYDENTGQPYFVERTETTFDLPDWLKKEWDRIREEDDDWYATGKIGVFPDQVSGQTFFVGKMLHMFDPRSESEVIGIDPPTEAEKAEVLAFITNLGAEGLTTEDIKIRVGTLWF